MRFGCRAEWLARYSRTKKTIDVVTALWPGNDALLQQSSEQYNIQILKNRNMEFAQYGNETPRYNCSLFAAQENESNRAELRIRDTEFNAQFVAHDNEILRYTWNFPRQKFLPQCIAVEIPAAFQKISRKQKTPQLKQKRRDATSRISGWLHEHNPKLPCVSQQANMLSTRRFFV